MKIIPLPQIRVEDFPKDVQKWISALLAPLNQFLTTVSTALQQNLAFSDNTLGQQQNLSFTWQNASASLPQKFQVTMTTAPNPLIVSQATENKTPVILLVAWQYLNGSIVISDIAKIASGVVSAPVSGAAYTLRLRMEA